MKREKRTIIQKIEFDSVTREPITVQLTENDLPLPVQPEEKPATCEKHDINATSARQLVMKQVFGFESKNSQIDKRQKLFKNLFATLFVIVVVAVLAWTAFNDFGSGERLPSWEEVDQIFSKTWRFLIYALLSLFGFYLFKALKLSLMCKSMTGKAHFKTCVETAIFGIYYNNVTPFAVGGQPFEIYHLSKNGVHGGVASSLPIATYFLNQIAFVIIGLVCLLTYSKNRLHLPAEMVGIMPSLLNVAAIIGLCVSLIMPLLIVLFSLMPRFTSKIMAIGLGLGNKLRLVKDPRKLAIKTYRTVIHNSRCIKKIASKPLVFIPSFLMSFFEHLCGTSIAYFVLCFFGFDWGGGIIEWAQVIQICVLINIAISFIPTPGNAGAADLSFYLIFKTGLGLSGGQKFGGFAFPATITWRILSFYSTIAIGFVFAKYKKYSNKFRKKKEEKQQ